mgnify:CR=1 FL=1
MRGNRIQAALRKIRSTHGPDSHYEPAAERGCGTFRYFREQGVSIRVISGDNPETVSRVAIQAGIEAPTVRGCSTLKSDSSLEAAAEKYKVFGRVTPEQKCRLIRAMQKNGHTRCHDRRRRE